MICSKGFSLGEGYELHCSFYFFLTDNRIVMCYRKPWSFRKTARSKHKYESLCFNIQQITLLMKPLGFPQVMVSCVKFSCLEMCPCKVSGVVIFFCLFVLPYRYFITEHVCETLKPWHHFFLSFHVFTIIALLSLLLSQNYYPWTWVCWSLQTKSKGYAHFSSLSYCVYNS